MIYIMFIEHHTETSGSMAQYIMSSFSKNRIWKIKYSIILVKKSIRHYLNQVIKVYITTDMSCLHHVFPGIMEQDG